VQFERGISTMPHCLEWYKLIVLRARLLIQQYGIAGCA